MDCGIAGDIARASQAQVQAYINCLQPSGAGAGAGVQDIDTSWLFISIALMITTFIMLRCSKGRIFNFFLFSWYGSIGTFLYQVWHLIPKN